MFVTIRERGNEQSSHPISNLPGWRVAMDGRSTLIGAYKVCLAVRNSANRAIRPTLLPASC
jgi:hypothetical protein